MANRKGVFIGAYVPNELKESLRRRAAAEHRTLSQEITRILNPEILRNQLVKRKQKIEDMVTSVKTNKLLIDSAKLTNSMGVEENAQKINDMFAVRFNQVLKISTPEPVKEIKKNDKFK